MGDNYLLSLCIPTYNRSIFLEQSLKRLMLQYRQLKDSTIIEIIISDNCSIDNTSEIVEKYILDGLPVKYIKNPVNLGMDGNFVQCFKMAKGRYVWLLGDDDFLVDDGLSHVLTVLDEKEWGLVHLQPNSQWLAQSVPFSNSRKFISEVSFWITFISANIVNTKYVSNIDFDKYLGTYFTLIPLYLTSAFSEKDNLLVSKKILEDAADSKTNGGYNYFEVFVLNYLCIWREFVSLGYISNRMFRIEKYKLFRKLLLSFMLKLLYRKEGGNYSVDGAWKILFREYWGCPYFYFFTIGSFVKNKLNMYSK